MLPMHPVYVPSQDVVYVPVAAVPSLIVVDVAKLHTEVVCRGWTVIR